VTDGISVVFYKSKLLAFLLFCCVLTSNIATVFYQGTFIPQQPYAEADERVSTSHYDFLTWLRENKISEVLTPYWIAYRLAFESNEQVIPFLSNTAGEPRLPYKMKSHFNSSSYRQPVVSTPLQAKIYSTQLTRYGYSYLASQQSEYAILYNIRQKYVANTKITLKGISSNVNQATVIALADKDLNTRWSTASPQAKGMYVLAMFNRPQLVSGIELDLAKWQTDFPREFILSCISRRGREIPFGKVPIPGKALHSSEVLNDLKVLFRPKKCTGIKIILVTGDSFFDWSIAELTVFKP
jgi:hypothetical protein